MQKRQCVVCNQQIPDHYTVKAIYVPLADGKDKKVIICQSCESNSKADFEYAVKLIVARDLNKKKSA